MGRTRARQAKHMGGGKSRLTVAQAQLRGPFRQEAIAGLRASGREYQGSPSSPICGDFQLETSNFKPMVFASKRLGWKSKAGQGAHWLKYVEPKQMCKTCESKRKQNQNGQNKCFWLVTRLKAHCAGPRCIIQMCVNEFANSLFQQTLSS